MRIDQSASSFQPITITLDSQHEVDTFIELLQVAYNNSSSSSDVERLADEMRSDMSRHGWQSSSYNC